MKKYLFIFTLASLLVGFNCMANDNSKMMMAKQIYVQHVLDWAGVYEGILPCIDCSGTKTVLTLNKDNTYKLQYTFLKDKKPYDSQLQSGVIEWDSHNPSIIHLINEDDETLFFIGEHNVTLLNDKGQSINTGHNLILKQTSVF